MTMKEEIEQQLLDAAARLKIKKLFGRPGDVFSMRLPGTNDFLWLQNEETDVKSSLESESTESSKGHGTIYAIRPDAGAILYSSTEWSEQLAELGRTPPTLFDEQARHIGAIARPVPCGDIQGLVNAVKTGSNIAIYGKQCVRIGMTRDRIVFNAELFEKCASAFVIASCTGIRLRTIPGWVRFIAGGRLRKDQRRAAASYEQGSIPQGMNAY